MCREVLQGSAFPELPLTLFLWSPPCSWTQRAADGTGEGRGTVLPRELMGSCAQNGVHGCSRPRPPPQYSRAGHHLHGPVAGDAFHPLKQFPGRHPTPSAAAPAGPHEATPALGSAWGRLQVRPCLRARASPQIPLLLAWPGSAQLHWPQLTVTWGHLGPQWGIKVVVVSLLHGGTLEGMRGDLRTGAPQEDRVPLPGALSGWGGGLALVPGLPKLPEWPRRGPLPL